MIHPEIEKFKFIVAGKQFGYPGFNGQIANIHLGLGRGSFMDTEAEFNQWLKARAEKPALDIRAPVTFKQVADPVDKFEKKVVTVGGEA